MVPLRIQRRYLPWVSVVSFQEPDFRSGGYRHRAGRLFFLRRHQLPFLMLSSYLYAGFPDAAASVVSGASTDRLMSPGPDSSPFGLMAIKSTARSCSRARRVVALSSLALLGFQCRLSITPPGDRHRQDAKASFRQFSLFSIVVISLVGLA